MEIPPQVSFLAGLTAVVYRRTPTKMKPNNYRPEAWARGKMGWASFLSVFLIPPFLAVAAQHKAAWQGPNRPVYVVTRNHYAEGFSPEGPTAKFKDLIAIEIFNPKPRREGEEAVYNLGEPIALFSGGERSGNVRITKVLPLQCDSTAAVVSTDSSIPFEKDAMALATNAEKISPHANFQKKADAADEKSAKDLAMIEFRKHGVPESFAKDIKIDQLLSTRIDQSDTRFLIGWLFVEGESGRHEVFLIGRVDASGAAAELARYHKTSDLEDGKDSQDVRFVDQLDLDGDGSDEIVVEVTFYESEAFEIYKRESRTWTRVHVGGQGGC